jgi:DNA repair exonuclease SbcCD nuclease subunit
VHIFAAPRFDPLALAADVTVWGAACPASDPQAWRQTACSPGAQHLLLAHAPSPRTTEHTTGQVTAPVFAVSEDTLAAAGFSLALLGGSHQPQLPAGGARIVFPGSPQPLDWDDGAADRGATLVTVDSAGCRVQPVPFRSWRLARVRVDVGGVLTAEEAARCIAEALAPGGASNRATQVAQVTLTGEPAADFTLADVDGALADVLGAEIRVVLRRAFVLPYDLDRLATEPTVRGALVRRVQAQLAAIDAAADPAARADLLAALKAALLALEGRQVHLDAIP